ncbi:hypothetical protein BDFB_007510, partial [Asbolus verrucosus]
MSKYLYICAIILINPLKILCIWPPPYEIKLNDGETFVISEFSDTDDLYNDEDEMIQDGTLKSHKNGDKEKYFRIHQMAIRHNKREMSKRKESSKNIKRIKEHNFDLDDAVPWEGGFVDKHGSFIQPDNENVYYLNEMAKSLIDSKIERKREEEKDNQENEKVEHYDYNSFKAEYDADVKKAQKQNDTLNFTDVKEDESLKEAVENIVDFNKEPKNCTAEEMKGIGLSALKCIITDLKRPRSKGAALQLAERILKISLIWFCVYVVIAIPCWCQR